MSAGGRRHLARPPRDRPLAVAGRHGVAAAVLQGPILQNSISAGKFSDKFLSSYNRKHVIQKLQIKFILQYVLDTILGFNGSKKTINYMCTHSSYQFTL
jgi:hypothetical protein